MRKPQRKSKILMEMINILNLIQSEGGKSKAGQTGVSKGKGKMPPQKAKEPLITWVAARINPAEYFPPALHDMAAYLLWVNAVTRSLP